MFLMQVVDVLLDIRRTLRKPQYTMAPELPLVLHSCEFEGLRFFSSAGNFLFCIICIVKFSLYSGSMTLFKF